MAAEIPYPPVFRDWRPERREEGRVSTGVTTNGVEVQMMMSSVVGGGSTWKHVELTERDACLLAASLLQRAGEKKLARRVLEKLDP